MPSSRRCAVDQQQHAVLIPVASSARCLTAGRALPGCLPSNAQLQEIRQLEEQLASPEGLPAPEAELLAALKRKREANKREAARLVRNSDQRAAPEFVFMTAGVLVLPPRIPGRAGAVFSHAYRDTA